MVPRCLKIRRVAQTLGEQSNLLIALCVRGMWLVLTQVLELLEIKLSIVAVLSQKLAMLATFHNLTIAQNKYHIRRQDCRKSMGDDQTGSILQELCQCRLNL